MTLYPFLLMAISTFLGAAGAFYLKKAALIKSWRMFFNRYFYTGVVIYFISSIGVVIALKYAAYGIVYPLAALTYVWTQVFAYVWGGERITKTQGAGVALVVLGAICVASAG